MEVFAFKTDSYIHVEHRPRIGEFLTKDIPLALSNKAQEAIQPISQGILQAFRKSFARKGCAKWHKKHSFSYPWADDRYYKQYMKPSSYHYHYKKPHLYKSTSRQICNCRQV